MAFTQAPTKIRRPSLVTWLGILVLLLSVVNLFAAFNGLIRRQIIESLNLSLPFSILIGTRFLWGMLWLVVAWGWWRLKSWGRLALPLAFLLYEVTLIGQQILFARQTYARGRLPFALALAALGLALIIWLITRPRIRQTFDPLKTHTIDFPPGTDGTSNLTPGT